MSEQVVGRRLRSGFFSERVRRRVYVVLAAFAEADLSLDEGLALMAKASAAGPQSTDQANLLEIVERLQGAEGSFPERLAAVFNTVPADEAAIIAGLAMAQGARQSSMLSRLASLLPA